MVVIGLTGGIGAGKSVVSRILRCKGYEVYDCDLEARIIMDGADDLRSDILSRFGAECIHEDGSLNRKEIARYVFSDDSHRLWLNRRVHGLVRDDVRRRIACAKSEIIFIESAILNSSGLTDICDGVWLVTAPEEVRIQRVALRDSAEEEMIRARMKSQLNEFSDFGSRPAHTIANDGISPLLPQIETLLQGVVKRDN